MKVKDLLKESDIENNGLSTDKKDKLRNILSSMFSTIERFENGEDITSKDDKEKIEMLKDTIDSMTKQIDREKTIRGDG